MARCCSGEAGGGKGRCVGSLWVTLGSPKGNYRVTMVHLRLTMGYLNLKATVVHINVTLGHLTP